MIQGAMNMLETKEEKKRKSQKRNSGHEEESNDSFRGEK